MNFPVSVLNTKLHNKKYKIYKYLHIDKKFILLGESLEFLRALREKISMGVNSLTLYKNIKVMHEIDIDKDYSYFQQVQGKKQISNNKTSD